MFEFRCSIVIYVVWFLACCFCVAPTVGVERDDYLASVLEQTRGKVFRFQKMPVKVFVDSREDEEVAACQNAFSMWQKGTDNLISFEQVVVKEQARVVIEFISAGVPAQHLSEAGIDGGHTHLEWQFKRKLSSLGRSRAHVPPQIVEISLDALAERAPDKRAILLRNIVAHELGHALGLLSHSSVNSDMMYVRTDENSSLSERDLKTIRKLYQMKANVYL